MIGCGGLVRMILNTSNTTNMKITINQDHVESIKQKLIDDVITQAKRSAEKGLEYFTFYPGFNFYT